MLVKLKALYINFVTNTAPVSQIYNTSENLKFSDYTLLQKDYWKAQSLNMFYLLKFCICGES